MRIKNAKKRKERLHLPDERERSLLTFPKGPIARASDDKRECGLCGYVLLKKEQCFSYKRCL